jgi:hypothetical protein
MQSTFSAANVDGFPTAAEEHPSGRTSLGQNYPNPFTGSTTIPVCLPGSARARLEIRDLFNRTVAVLYDGMLHSGEHNFQWEPDAAGPGVYICLLISGEQAEKIKVVKL